MLRDAEKAMEAYFSAYQFLTLQFITVSAGDCHIGVYPLCFFCWARQLVELCEAIWISWEYNVPKGGIWGDDEP